MVNDIRGKRENNSINQVVPLFTSSADAVESINELFSNFCVKRSPFPLFPVDVPENFRVCNDELIYKLLGNLKTCKSSGSDGIPPLLLKYSANVLCRPLSHLINLSFRNGCVPEVLKRADVCPIPKTNPVKRDSLRPISLLPVICKVYEKAVLKKYYRDFIRCYDSSQYAYRPKSSTVCALVFIHDFTLRLLELPDIVAVRILTFDMTRAFDCVPHHLLLACISNLDIADRDIFVNWLNNYLSDRQQRVKLGETKSSFTNVTSGIPQGSVLGPYLFALYMSTYKAKNSSVGVVKYADDVTLIVPVYKKDSDSLELIKSEVDHFKSWCCDNKMTINENKTKVLNINFSCTPIQPVPDFENVICVKILGLLFNCKLSWSNHVDYVISRVSKRLYVLRILKRILSHDQLIVVFNSIIRSIIEYASPVFINVGDMLDLKLKALCKRAFRIIHGFDVRRCSKCCMLDVSDRRQTLALRLFRQALLNSNHVLHNLLPKTSHRSQRLVLPHVRTSRRINGFVFACSLLHNSVL